MFNYLVCEWFGWWCGLAVIRQVGDKAVGIVFVVAVLVKVVRRNARWLLRPIPNLSHYGMRLMALVQTIGRAARNANGRAILYGDKITRSMQQAIDETNRRREKQQSFNKEHHIEPKTIFKSVTDILELSIPGSGGSITTARAKVAEPGAEYKALSPKQSAKVLKQLEDKMYAHARNLEFEEAAKVRDQIRLLQAEMVV